MELKSTNRNGNIR